MRTYNELLTRVGELEPLLRENAPVAEAECNVSRTRDPQQAGIIPDF